ncbi:MAG TPA: DUF1269 domain-containing protein [Anaerolineae bacterium]|nr:DUF1269 domain-containing protein [Anaerolineae bacterium]
MATMVVLAFQDETGAERMRDKLIELQKQQLISLSDAAVVVRRSDGKIKVKQAVSLVGAGALGGAFWGMLIGLLFWAPWLGLAVGAAAGALGGALSDVGVDDKFIKEVGSTIEPGHSALFLLVERWTEDKVLDEIKDMGATVLQTSLSKEDEAKLKAAFGAAA